MYSLVRLGSRSARLLPILAERIEGITKPEPGRLRMPETAFIDLPRGWAKSDGDLSYNDPIKALEMIRPDATAFVPLLGKAMKSPHYWVREAAIEAILAVATWSSPSRAELAGALLEVLTDDRLEPDTREVEALNRFTDRNRAAVALAKLDPPAQESAAEQLAGDLYDLGSLRSYEAALLLHHLGARPATVGTTLQGFIRDGDEARRRIAMTFLGPFAGPAEAPAVLRAITAPGADRKIDLRGQLHWRESLGQREGDPGFQQFVREIQRRQTSLIEPGVRALKAMGAQVERRAIGQLIAMVREPGADPHRRCCAIIALGEFGPDATEAIPVLDAAIGAHEAAVRWASGGAAASDSSGVLATLAIGSIAAEGNADAIAVLARLVADPGASVALQASWMLVGLGPNARTAVPALVKGLKDPR